MVRRWGEVGAVGQHAQRSGVRTNVAWEILTLKRIELGGER